MKVSTSWLKNLVNLKVPIEEVVRLLPLRTIGTKEVTSDFIELEMKGYNRADLLSMRGVAREVAAITDSQIKFEDQGSSKFDLPETPVEVENPELCPTYCVAKIEGLKVGPSPKDWTKKLEDAGLRPVNNIADVTNLVMLEFGQPMHAFDARGVKDEVIIVRTAKKRERITTLDGKTRDLDSSDLLIADSQNGLGIAGVMGGKDSEVSDSTTTILLEAAIFDPVSIRRTSKRHGLYSEASKRFQHGLTRTNLLQALSAAIKMYEGLGGKLTAITFVGDLEDKPKTITLNHQRLNNLIGIEIPADEVKASLEKLGFKIDNWQVTIPYWRLDCNIEEDLIEEVARMYGYEKIPPQRLRGKQPQKIDQTLPNSIYDLKKALFSAGLTEVQTYSFYSSQIIENLKLRIENLLKVANPISSETEYLRDNLWPNLVEVVGKNLKQGFKDIAIFEIGKVYSPKKGELPNESYHLAIALMNNTDNPIAELFSLANSLKIGGTPGLLGNNTLFHPTRITNNMAEIHPRVLNMFGIEKKVAVLEIDLQ